MDITPDLKLRHSLTYSEEEDVEWQPMLAPPVVSKLAAWFVVGCWLAVPDGDQVLHETLPLAAYYHYLCDKQPAHNTK